MKSAWKLIARNEELKYCLGKLKPGSGGNHPNHWNWFLAVMNIHCLIQLWPAHLCSSKPSDLSMDSYSTQGDGKLQWGSSLKLREVLESQVPRASSPNTPSSTERNHSNLQINSGHKEGNKQYKCQTASDTKRKGDSKSSIHIHIPEITNNFPGGNPNGL